MRYLEDIIRDMYPNLLQELYLQPLIPELYSQRIIEHDTKKKLEELLEKGQHSTANKLFLDYLIEIGDYHTLVKFCALLEEEETYPKNRNLALTIRKRIVSVSYSSTYTSRHNSAIEDIETSHFDSSSTYDFQVLTNLSSQYSGLPEGSHKKYKYQRRQSREWHGRSSVKRHAKVAQKRNSLGVFHNNDRYSRESSQNRSKSQSRNLEEEEYDTDGDNVFPRISRPHSHHSSPVEGEKETHGVVVNLALSFEKLLTSTKKMFKKRFTKDKSRNRPTRSETNPSDSRRRHHSSQPQLEQHFPEYIIKHHYEIVSRIPHLEDHYRDSTPEYSSPEGSPQAARSHGKLSPRKHPHQKHHSSAHAIYDSHSLYASMPNLARYDRAGSYEQPYYRQ